MTLRNVTAAILALLTTAQIPAQTRYPDTPDRDVVAAMQKFEYRYLIDGDAQFRDIVVEEHGRIAYVYAALGVDGRGDLLERRGGLWHELGTAKGQFPPDVFTSQGVSPRIALMAVQDQCPPLRLTWRAMTADERVLARHSVLGHVPARRVRGLDGRVYSLDPAAYRICEI